MKKPVQTTNEQIEYLLDLPGNGISNRLQAACYLYLCEYPGTASAETRDRLETARSLAKFLSQHVHMDVNRE